MKIKRIILTCIILSIAALSCACGGTKVKTTSASKATPKPKDESEIIKEKVNKLKDTQGLVLIKDVDSSIVIDLRYATSDNFTKKKVYPSAVCALEKNTAIKLAIANSELKKLGYRIKIWDAYRPLYVQKIFWSICPDDNFVANPNNGGSIHNHGCAVDITLTDMNGNEVAMPTKFDDFTDKAMGSDPDMPADAKKNLKVLRDAMKKSGFYTITTEWWHFEDSDQEKYPLLDVKLEDIGK